MLAGRSAYHVYSPILGGLLPTTNLLLICLWISSSGCAAKGIEDFDARLSALESHQSIQGDGNQQKTTYGLVNFDFAKTGMDFAKYAFVEHPLRSAMYAGFVGVATWWRGQKRKSALTNPPKVKTRIED